jgi:phage-related protein
MSDNANKMGTDIASLQNAYQGFAKQNYTMLDNLKIGYGGTKEEMERLLADAEELSGVHYDISNLNDVYEAIHVIQTEMDITGTTALEAATTISGSTASMKASWQNLLTGMADDNADFEG